MNSMLTSPNHLLSHLLQTTPEAVEHLEKVILSPGSWRSHAPDDGESHVYFPEAGLMGVCVSDTLLSGTGMALLGCQTCWWSEGVSPLQMQVLQAGHALRIRWAVLQARPQRYAPWMMQAAATSQQLIQQMAQMAYCAQNHTQLQRLANGLLTLQIQNPSSDGRVSVAELAHWFSCPEVEAQAAVQSLHSHGALQLAKHPGIGVQLQSLQPQRLVTLACSCHLQWVQSHGTGGVIQPE